MPASATLAHPSETLATDAQTSPATPHLRAVRQRSLEALDEILQDKTQPARERRLAAASLLRYAAAIETLELRLADRVAERAERNTDPDDNTDDDDSYEDEPLDDEDHAQDEDEEHDDFGPPPNPCPDDMITMQAPPRAHAQADQAHHSHQSQSSHPSPQSHPPSRPTPNLAPRDAAHEAHLHQALRTARDLLNRQAHTTGLAAQPPP